MSGARTQIFVSYSHADTEWLKRLQVHLKPLEQAGTIAWWDDTWPKSCLLAVRKRKFQ